MILKKPYALLIKNFRKIHILLTILSIFTLVQSHKLLSFFHDYIANNYSVTVTDSLVKDTISPWLYLSIILTILILIAVYILLKVKKKPTKIYFFTILYYVILLIFIIIAAFLIGNLSDGLWPAASARTYRDLANIVYYPSYFFIVLMVIRSLGFDVKKFNFKSDLKELEITDADSEEIELNLNFDTYKAERNIRRFIRELKYYYLENKKVIYILGTCLVIVLGFLVYKNTEKVKYTYKEAKTFSLNGLTYNIKESMLTNIDLNGNIIDNDKYYVVIKFGVTNNTTAEKKIEYSNFKLYYGFEYKYPSLNMGNSFLDYGDPYMNDIISAKKSKTYIMAYEIDKKYINRNFKIVLYQGFSTKSKEFLAKTITIKLDPILYTNTEIVRRANLNESVSLSSTMLGSASFKVNNPVFGTRYEYNYQSCYQNSCRTYTDVVVADANYQAKRALIVLDYELSLDETASSYTNINGISSFASNFLEVEYEQNGKNCKTSAKYANPSRLKDKLVLEVDGVVLNSEYINLLVTIRNRSYSIKLK